MTQPGQRAAERIPLRFAPLRSALCPGVSYLFTSRHGGISREPYETLNLSDSVGDDPQAVAANRARLLAAAQTGSDCPAGVAWLRQVHGARVVQVTGPGQAAEADAMYTATPGVALGITAADCAPVLLADPVARLCGAAHAGRPGLAAGVLASLIAEMTAAGGSPAAMHAVIGPVICGGCYEVPAALRAQVAAVVPEAACVTRAGTAGIDIAAGLRAQLAGHGVTAVLADPRCPAESADLYSYRRDGLTGRFAGLIWLDTAPERP